MLVYLVTGIILLVYLVLVWFVGTWLHLLGSSLWFLRGALAVIGLIAAGVFLWFHHKSKKEQEASGAGQADAQTGEIDAIVHTATRRLKASTLGRGASLSNLPLVFLLGDSGSTKTSTIIHSALDPELLAGQVYQDNQVLPTQAANIWYTRQAIFVDPAGSLMAQPPRWKKLLKLLQPGSFSSVFGKAQQAPRAAIVCYDSENFVKPGASESGLSAARKLGVRLQEISQGLGISFPVYVLFTRVDRITFFPEFVRGLSKEEASEVLGATLPVRSLSTGVYADEESRRLTKAFDELSYALAERRIDLLVREHEADKLPSIYEFPRELRKLRTLLVQFLVELARPSQLGVNPFLRGFYFCGVRPVIVEDVVGAMAPEVQAPEPAMDAGATRIFSAGGGPLAPAPVPFRAAGSRKVPQWSFLTQLFNDIIVKDRVALAASGFSSRVNLLRRVLLAVVGLISIVCIVGFLVSFLGNHALENDVRAATADLRSVHATHEPSLTDLQKLDHLRQDLTTIATYKKDGVPLSLRWGLYSGDEIYPEARKVYFERFRQLLFTDTQGKLLSDLRGLPDKPGPNDAYETAYNELKAYLITTSNNDKSTKDFLSPVLLSEWQSGKQIDTDRSLLANLQFDFYSMELATANPFSSNNDTLAIARARSYLSHFAGIERFYLPLLSKASAKNPDVSFSEQFRDAASVVVSPHKVRGAFTRGGFQFMQEAMQNPSLYMAGEEWVLGKATASELDPATLQQKMRDRYYQDFTSEWRTVLQTSAVVHYTDFGDAGHKLETLTGPTSPLLELFWFISHNTDVGVPEITEPFLPVQALEPPGPPGKLPDQYILPSNKEYIVALNKLQSDLAPMVAGPSDALTTQVSASAGAAKVSVTQVMGTRVDQRFHNESLVRTLLEEPIVNVEDLLGRAPKDALNGAGKDFCSKFAQLTGKYPFNPNATDEVSVDQLNSILAPNGGALWTFYNGKLAQLLPKDGSRYSANPAASVKLNPAFVDFFNRIAGLSEALYPPGSATPHFSYSLTPLPSNVDGLILRIGADTISGTGQQKTFTWTGAPTDVEVTTKGHDTMNSFSGVWSVFRFVADAHSQVTGPSTNLEWIMQSNGHTIMLPGNKPKSYDYQLQVSGFNPFRASELSGLRCVSQVAR
ncbi:MAG: ImcF-related family protein [Terriglobales bacterium]